MKSIAVLRSIPFKLSVIATCILLVISITTEVPVYYDTIESYLTDLKSNQLNEAQELSEEIESKIQQRVKFIRVLVQLLTDDLNLSKDRLGNILENTLREVDLFSQGLFILSTDGVPIIAGGPHTLVQDIRTYDQFEWFVRAKQKEGVVISKVFRSKYTDELLLFFADSICDSSGTLIAVLAAPVRISTQLLNSIVNQKATEKLFESIVISESDKIIIESAGENLVFKPIRNQKLYQFYKNANSVEGVDVVTNEEGTTDIAAFSTIESLGWVVMVHTNIDKNLIPVREEFIIDVSSELMLLVFINVVVIFATLHFYFLPLQHSAKKVRSMDMNNELPHLKKIRNDEIGDLIEGFNALVDAVNERTIKLEEANLHLQELSQTDALTGVFNRRWFDHSLKYLWRMHQRNRQPLSLIILDIDFFKQYNDSYGHLQGDTCLAAVAKTLNDSLRRPTDIFARYGGEEFAAIVENDEEGVLSIAETMRQSIENLAMEHTKSPYGIVTISLGMATLTPDINGSPDLLVKYADIALYGSKEQGRNKVTMYELYK